MTTKRKIRQLTIGTHDFPTLMEKPESKYVDKTDLLYQLATDNETQFFISRPRRFGKSLMLSTLRAMFEGRRDLFKGLKIDKENWEGWTTPVPVLLFDMAKLAPSEGISAMKETLRLLIDEKAEEAGCDKPSTELLGFAFEELLSSVAQKSPTGKVVVLIDEYDSPVQGFLDNPAELKEVNAFLHDFYRRLKNNAAIIRFLMITGVTKLTKLSVFSGLNHLIDLSMSPRFATLFGYTPQELDGTLRENVEALGARLGMGYDETRGKILEWYDGYRFSPQSKERVVNPVSIGKLFSPDGGKFKSYWETTGGSSLVFNRVKAIGKLPEDFEHLRADAMMLDVCDAATLPVEALLYQSGYLTIKDVIPPPKQTPEEAKADPKMETYVLAPPNLEIRASLKRGFISQVLGMKEAPFDTLLDRARRLIAAGDITEVVETMLFSLYAQVPPDWRIKDEAEAKRYFQLFFTMLGADPAPEFPSARGYADAVIQRTDAVFVVEFKYDRSVEEAMRQIRDMGYAEKWRGGPRPVTLVGVNFNSAKRNIDIPLIEPL